ncbi:TetR family transcriptional regulator [Actinomycetospora succinea]|uniref:TetR family transcriptional regulator n=1 Tax=Actinomycetospora succinea TaxID=663603 RepID=A0A4R6VA53_9PSEU|nr:TetR/AcrR family transcriptional regulator [Actinomycetospora succinea]TDQ58787.1 TetR family transcriptional regulator [Actinomycetospora succinea]
MPKRPGPNAGPTTREAVLAAARRLFTDRGYDGTSMRDIAAEVGLTTAALYYHFPAKDAILAALAQPHRDEIDALVAWSRAQENHPGLLRETALRWVESAGQDRLDGLRLARAVHPALAGDGALTALTALVDDFADPADPVDRLQVRLLFEAFTCAALAAAPDDDLATIVATARWMVLAMTAG